MDSCAIGAECTDAGHVCGPAPDMEAVRTPRNLTASLRREMLLLAHADFALLHHRRDEAAAVCNAEDVAGVI